MDGDCDNIFNDGRCHDDDDCDVRCDFDPDYDDSDAEDDCDDCDDDGINCNVDCDCAYDGDDAGDCSTFQFFEKLSTMEASEEERIKCGHMAQYHSAQLTELMALVRRANMVYRQSSEKRMREDLLMGNKTGLIQRCVCVCVCVCVHVYIERT